MRGEEFASRMTQAQLENADFSNLVGSSSIVIQGDGQSNGNLRIGLQQTLIGGNQKTIQIVDFGVQNSMDAPETRLAADRPAYIVVHPAGAVQMSNDQILDRSGKGLATDVWSRNTRYNTFTNGPLSFSANMLKEMAATPSDEANEILNSVLDPEDARAKAYIEIVADNVPVQLVKYTSTTIRPEDQLSWTFDVNDGANPRLVQQLVGGRAVDLSETPPSQGLSASFNGLVKQFSNWADMSKCFAGTCFNPRPGSGLDVAPVSAFDEEAMSSDDELAAEIVAAFDESDPGPSSRRLAPIGENEIQPDEDCTEPNTCGGTGDIDKANPLVDGVDGDASIAVVRNAGVFASVISFSTPALIALGVGAAAEAVIFIILDLVLGRFKAAAFGALALGLGIGATLLIGGPIGLLLGAAVATLFFFLPGLFESEELPAPTDNKTEIVQYAFFGNKEHTGQWCRVF